jgi:mevalonate kinase
VRDGACDHPKLRFVLGALRAFQPKLLQLNIGLDIHIRCEFSSTMGLGSSAAVLAAMLVGLNAITQTALSLLELFALGHQQILAIQGRGSGTDLAASLRGGFIYFQPAHYAPAVIHQLDAQAWLRGVALQLIYAGYKTPTAEVLAHVAAQWQYQPTELNALYAKMGHTTQRAYHALQHNHLGEFFAACQHYQSLMTQLGVTDAPLQAILDQLTQIPDVRCAKISGSGLGDCVLALREVTNESGNQSTDPLNLQSNNDQAWSSHPLLGTLQTLQTIQVRITDQGAFVERIYD